MKNKKSSVIVKHTEAILDNKTINDPISVDDFLLIIKLIKNDRYFHKALCDNVMYTKTAIFILKNQLEELEEDEELKNISREHISIYKRLIDALKPYHDYQILLKMSV